MSTERRFLVASSLARLIQRERGTTGRIVEAYFPPRPDRRQLVRVEPHRSCLILLTQADDGRFAQDATEVPLHHAEALVDATAGTVAYDRTHLPLGGGVEAVLDRFIIPQGLDLLTVTIPSDPHAFAPLPWFGLEVTDEPAFAGMGLALDGAPHIDGTELSNVALEALLDTLEGRSPDYRRAMAQSHDEASDEATASLSSPAVDVGLQAFIAATPAAHDASLRRREAVGHAEAQHEDSEESEAMRRLAWSLAPRVRSPR